MPTGCLPRQACPPGWPLNASLPKICNEPSIACSPNAERSLNTRKPSLLLCAMNDSSLSLQQLGTFRSCMSFTPCIALPIAPAAHGSGLHLSPQISWQPHAGPTSNGQVAGMLHSVRGLLARVCSAAATAALACSMSCSLSNLSFTKFCPTPPPAKHIQAPSPTCSRSRTCKPAAHSVTAFQD